MENKPTKKKYVCRQCMVIRYFLFAAAALILCIPFASDRFIVLQELTAWHFVAAIWGIGVLGFLFKWLVEIPEDTPE